MEENNQVPLVSNATHSVPVAPSNPQDSTSPKPKSKLLLIAIGIVLFLIIAGSVAGFYVFKNQSDISTRPTAMPQITSTPIAMPDLTSDWKTYEGAEFSIKYPHDFTILDDYSQNILVSIMSPLSKIARKGHEPAESELKIEILSSENTTKTLDEIIDIEKQKPNERSTDPFIFEEKSLNISGQQAKMLKTQYSALYYVIHENMLFRIIQYPPVTTRQSEFEQILSSLKFNQDRNTDLTILLPTDWNFKENSAQRIFITDENGGNNVTFTKHNNQNLDEMVQMAKKGIVRDLTLTKHIIDSIEVTEYSGCLNPETCNRTSNIVLPIKDAYYLIHSPDPEPALLEKILAGIQLKS